MAVEPDPQPPDLELRASQRRRLLAAQKRDLERGARGRRGEQIPRCSAGVGKVGKFKLRRGYNVDDTSHWVIVGAGRRRRAVVKPRTVYDLSRGRAQRRRDDKEARLHAGRLGFGFLFARRKRGDRRRQIIEAKRLRREKRAVRGRIIRSAVDRRPGIHNQPPTSAVKRRLGAIGDLPHYIGKYANSLAVNNSLIREHILPAIRLSLNFPANLRLRPVFQFFGGRGFGKLKSAINAEALNFAEIRDGREFKERRPPALVCAQGFKQNSVSRARQRAAEVVGRRRRLNPRPRIRAL